MALDEGVPTRARRCFDLAEPEIGKREIEIRKSKVGGK
jgi:hypothetical protein